MKLFLLTFPIPFISESITARLVTKLTSKPEKVSRLGATHRGTWFTNHLQNGCMNTSEIDVPLALYLWFFRPRK